MKYFFKVFLFVVMGCVNYFSYAGDGAGKIVDLTVQTGSAGEGVVMLKTEINEDKADCSTWDDGSQWAFSLEHTVGRAMYSLLLVAQAQRKSIYVAGSGDCAVWGDRERPVAIRVNIQ